jgi:hypothetical protein
MCNKVLADAVGNKNQQKADLKHNSINSDPSSQAYPSENITHNPSPKSHIAKPHTESDFG